MRSALYMGRWWRVGTILCCVSSISVCWKPGKPKKVALTRIYEEVADNTQQHGEDRRAMESDYRNALTFKTVAFAVLRLIALMIQVISLVRQCPLPTMGSSLTLAPRKTGSGSISDFLVRRRRWRWTGSFTTRSCWNSTCRATGPIRRRIVGQRKRSQTAEIN